MLSSSLLVAALAAVLTSGVLVEGHVALWHPSMYGFCDGGGGKNDTCINTSNPVVPLMEIPFAPGVGGSGWWFRGVRDQPPIPGTYLELPSGGTVVTELNCNKGLTSYNIGQKALQYENVCASPISVHTADTWEGGPTDATKGCALALAWESDPEKLTPEDFVVITTNRTCPFYARTAFDIPSDLPACPDGGCHAVWGWIHGAGPAGGSSFQMYLTFFRARITGATQTDPLPSPRVARRCKDTPELCVKGPKSPHYWGVSDRFNALNPNDDPPYYNPEYGLSEGAQTDLRYVADEAAENAWKDDWDYLGCYADNGPTRLLSGTKFNDWQNSPDFCRASCSNLGFAIAAVAFSSECWCGDELSITGNGEIADDGTYCNTPCAGDASATCGGAYISNVYAKKGSSRPAASTVASSTSGAVPTGALEQANVTGWKSLGCWEDGTPRALDGIFIDDSSKMSPAWCLAQCAASGYNLGGLEYSNQCLCGNSLASSKELSSDRCGMPCALDASVACGGSYAFNLYARDTGASSVATSASVASDSTTSTLAASSTGTSSSYGPASTMATEAASSATPNSSSAASGAVVASASSSAQVAIPSSSSAAHPVAAAPVGAAPPVVSRCMLPEQSSRRSAALATQTEPTSTGTALVARATDEAEHEYWPSDDAEVVGQGVPDDAAEPERAQSTELLSPEQREIALMHHRRMSFMKRLLLRRHRD